MVKLSNQWKRLQRVYQFTNFFFRTRLPGLGEVGSFGVCQLLKLSPLVRRDKPKSATITVPSWKTEEY